MIETLDLKGSVKDHEQNLAEITTVLDHELTSARSRFSTRVSEHIAESGAAGNRYSASLSYFVEMTATDEVRKRAEILFDACAAYSRGTRVISPKAFVAAIEARLREEAAEIWRFAESIDLGQYPIKAGFFNQRLELTAGGLATRLEKLLSDPLRQQAIVRLFVSHSSEDVELAALIVQLFSTALGLRSQQIRCTSVDGYRLPGGADSDEQLRDEALAAECFVGILSAQSLVSAYVLFELGARWGAKKHLVPLLAPGMRPQTLRGPLKGLNALSCDKMAELHQLVHEVGKLLHIEIESPAVFQRHIEAVVYYATTRQTPVDADASTPPPSSSAAETANQPLRQQPEDDYSEAGQVISKHCEREWPDDFSMQAYCMKQQLEAVAGLRRGPPADMPEDVFRQIRRKCARDWPDDYSMRLYSEEQQIAAYRTIWPSQHS